MPSRASLPGRSLALAFAALALVALVGLAAGWWWFYRAAVDVSVPAAAAPARPPGAPGPSPAALAALDAALAQAADARRALETRIAELEERMRGDLCPKPPPPPPPPPPPKPEAQVPEDRWNRKDLSLLEGCWRLGRDHPVTVTWRRSDKPPTEVCTVRTGRICFDRNGSGVRSQKSDCKGLSYACEAPVTATFEPDGTLRTTQPQRECTNDVTWLERTLTCRRVSDALVMCRDSRGGEIEFRR